MSETQHNPKPIDIIFDHLSYYVTGVKHKKDGKL